MLLRKSIYNLIEIPTNKELKDLVNDQFSHLGKIINEQLIADSNDISTSMDFLKQNLENNFSRNITINTDNIIFEEKLIFGKPNDIDYKSIETNEKLTYLEILITYISLSREESTGKNYDNEFMEKILNAFNKKSNILGIVFRILNIAGKNYSCYSIDTIET